MSRHEVLKALHDEVPHLKTVFLQVLPVDDFQDGFSHCTGYRIPAKGIEVYTVGKGMSDIRRGNHCSQRYTVANALCHGNNFRDNPLCFKPPVMCPRTAKTRLDLVRYAEATGPPDVIVGVFQKAIGVNNCPTNSLNGLCEKPGNPARGCELDKVFDVSRILCPCLGIITTPAPPVGIG